MKINLGCQNNSPGSREGWKNIDIENSDFNFNLSKMPWPLESDSVTDMIASHVIEHFTQDVGYSLIQEIYRVLAPGGILRVGVPNMDRFIKARQTNDWSIVGHAFWRDLNWLVGGDHREPNLFLRHYYMYSTASMSWTLQQIGFTDITVRDYYELHNPAHAPISVYIDAKKPCTTT